MKQTICNTDVDQIQTTPKTSTFDIYNAYIVVKPYI